ncbi:MAG TPA: class I SAM-dependent methyltransferase [Bryobacteraceae bacterium]|nr:class I SAM-dependent methyltransferase [Bryobacteraceae bacterium]
MATRETPVQAPPYWENGAGFFGEKYMEGDDSIEGFLSTPQTLPARTTREVNGIVDLLSLPAGASVLDCPCGYGRHSVGLAKKGMHVLGSDINEEMLAAAHRNAEGVPNVRFARENMLELSYREDFDAVINMFLAFGFFEDDRDNTRVLANFFEALKPGGQFLLHSDVNVARIATGKYKFRETRHLRSGRSLEIVESFDRESKRLHGQWILVDSVGAREELPPYSCRVYTAAEAIDLCKSVGFESVQLYGGWNGKGLAEVSEELIVVARKGK